MEKISMNDIRKKNYSDVYRLIYQERRISKSRIASSLEMSLPTVTQHLSTLETEQLIEKQGQIASGIGRKAAAYIIRPEVRVSVGVEILPDHITAVVLNLYGMVIGEKKLSCLFLRKMSILRHCAIWFMNCFRTRIYQTMLYSEPVLAYRGLYQRMASGYCMEKFWIAPD